MAEESQKEEDKKKLRELLKENLEIEFSDKSPEVNYGEKSSGVLTLRIKFDGEVIAEGDHYYD